ncbi:alcohol dehydrogenase 1 [[Candida] jaroonii]|uniref:Alcohol dehydrogenase 1 n=1 Tax=[Candida] jaroonii TaxID=467808 RepID=A0ACA9Y4R3_9ASCO|nr:alcohol dehydrogenase 1 [[Candida] jaroonii]
MKAVTYQAPFDYKVKDVPKPIVENADEAILKVKYSGICGTDLHSYRGHLNLPKDQVIGHEFVGTIVEKGDNVNFEIGDNVVSTFTIQCGECEYCKVGFSSQCDVTNTFGKVGLPGGQAEYVKVPYANNGLIKCEDDPIYVMMADIFITGYFGVKKILNHLGHNVKKDLKPREVHGLKVLQLGLGPVGICALTILKHYGFDVTAVDNVPSRLDTASKLGAHTLNFQTDDIPKDSFDFVLEAVGNSKALETGFHAIKREGLLVVLGMSHEPLPFDGLQCYLKNINLSFGRCHAQSLFPESLELFETLKDKFSSFIDCLIPIEEVEKGYELFDHHKVNKVIIDFTK